MSDEKKQRRGIFVIIGAALAALVFFILNLLLGKGKDDSIGDDKVDTAHRETLQAKKEAKESVDNLKKAEVEHKKVIDSAIKNQEERIEKLSELEGGVEIKPVTCTDLPEKSKSYQEIVEEAKSNQKSRLDSIGGFES